MRDLFVVVADLDAENAIKTLLRERQQSLGIRLDFNPDRPPQGDLLRYFGRDSGCYKNAVDILRHHSALTATQYSSLIEMGVVLKLRRGCRLSLALSSNSMAVDGHRVRYL